MQDILPNQKTRLFIGDEFALPGTENRLRVEAIGRCSEGLTEATPYVDVTLVADETLEAEPDAAASETGENELENSPDEDSDESVAVPSDAE